MRCYLDTISIYKEFSSSLVLDNTIVKWKIFKKANRSETHFFVRHRGITCRYYPNQYGVGRLWITTSVPKLLAGSNLRPLNLPNLDMLLYQTISDILTDIIKLSASDRDIASWQVSRADLFLLHQVPPKQRQWYLQAYSRLALGSFVPHQHKGTHYLFSTLKKHRAAGVTVRIYDKPQEMGETSLDTPKVIDKDIEYYLRLGDDLVDYVRLEFAFRRRVLKSYLHQTSVAVADILREDFQVDRINKMIVRLGLHRPIVSRSHMKQHLDKIFTKKPTRQKVGKYISMLNSRGAYPSSIRNSFTEGEIKYYRMKVNRYGLHTIVSEFEDLKPIQPLQ